jgi:hypothetical protein
MSYDYKKEIKAHLIGKYGKTVQIQFNGDDPTLIFADGASSQTKREAVSFVENLIKKMGGKVEFYPELETELK